MKLERLPLTDVPGFSKIFLDYLAQEPSLQAFYGHPPRLTAFEEQISLKKHHFSDAKRQLLVEALRQQYGGMKEAPHAQIEALGLANTFTVTTGHQLSLATGPLYFVYKIITTIRLAQVLRATYPAYQFVPVYWMASEDHDFEEINHFYLFGKKHAWLRPSQGPVGRLSPEGLPELLGEIEEMPGFFKEAYQSAPDLARATRQLVQSLFGIYGLVTIDGDDPALKASFAPLMKEDIFSGHSGALVAEASQKLTDLGYKTQVNPREINFFYIEDQIRARIIAQDAQYQVLNTPIRYTEEEFKALIMQSPQKLSPNVVMRPLYQEHLLPNLAYVGGPGELAYWLQLKPVFDFYQVPYPILKPRNFATIISGSLVRKFQKLGLPYPAIFQEYPALKNAWLAQNSQNDISLQTEILALEQVFAQVGQKAALVDKSLGGVVGAEQQKARKALENIEKRLQKAEEKKMETELKQIENLKEKLFPEGTLQERHDNLLSFYLNYPNFLEILIQNFDPFSNEMHILADENE
ncbi:MAG: bacillithiol biosynthesis cysteine-adding enzyme BshC [Microscillaceae bacterium]